MCEWYKEGIVVMDVSWRQSLHVHSGRLDIYYRPIYCEATIQHTAKLVYFVLKSHILFGMPSRL